MAALLSQQEALPVSAKTCREGFALFTDPRTLPSNQPRSNPKAAPPSPPGVTDYTPTVLTSRDA